MDTAGGNRLKALRTASGKTQLAVELDANLGIGYLQRLERGKVQHPERETLERLLDALGARFAERCEVLRLFGYAAPLTTPNDVDIQWAADLFHSHIGQLNIPAYLLDCAHRLLAWNPLVCRLFEAVDGGIFMPRLVFDPIGGIANAVLNADFFATQVRILQFERQRCGDDGGFIETLRQYPAFDIHWNDAAVQIPVRPVAQLGLAHAHGTMQFRLICETFAQDPRFRVIYYMPADTATLRQCLEWQR